MEKCAFRSPIGRLPPHRDFLRKRVLRILGRSRKNPFVWECGPAGCGIRAHFIGAILKIKPSSLPGTNWKVAIDALKPTLITFAISL